MAEVTPHPRTFFGPCLNRGFLLGLKNGRAAFCLPLPVMGTGIGCSLTRPEVLGWLAERICGRKPGFSGEKTGFRHTRAGGSRIRACGTAADAAPQGRCRKWLPNWKGYDILCELFIMHNAKSKMASKLEGLRRSPPSISPFLNLSKMASKLEGLRQKTFSRYPM